MFADKRNEGMIRCGFATVSPGKGTLKARKTPQASRRCVSGHEDPGLKLSGGRHSSQLIN